MLGFWSFYYFMGTFATAKAVNLKQLDDRVRKGRTGVHVLWTQSWIFPVHWSSHKQSLGDDSWKEAQWGIFQTVQGFCRMVLYSLDKAFPHVSTAHPATCRAWSFVYWKALEEYWPEILVPFGWSPRLSPRKQRLNFWLPDGLGQIASSLSFYFPHLEKEDKGICSISVKHSGVIHIPEL